MNQKSWQTVIAHTCLLGEGPVWDASRKTILWVDILQAEIHQFSPEKKEHKVFKTNAMVGAIALRESGGLVAALKNGFAFIDPEKGVTEPVADPEKNLPNNRFNDGKCDAAGRFWAGTMSIAGTPDEGNLYTLEPDLSVSVKLQHVACSNGLAWGQDGNILYYIDTPTRQVVAFDYDLADGNISNKRVVITIPAEEGFPDGMTIDTEGMLWIAMWDGWQVCRYNPVNGRLLDSISLPVSRVTSCTFGGDNLQDLYITSAKTGLSEIELRDQPHAGCLFVIKNLGFTGIVTSEFKG